MRLRNDPALAASFRWPRLAHEVGSNETQSTREQAPASVAQVRCWSFEAL